MRLIDADALIKSLSKNCPKDTMTKAIVEIFKACVDNEPTINAEPQWIPCSERLPKESGKYLITVLDGVGKRTTTAPYHPQSKSWTLTGRMAYWKVIAWMSMPEPWGGEQND